MAAETIRRPKESMAIAMAHTNGTIKRELEGGWKTKKYVMRMAKPVVAELAIVMTWRNQVPVRRIL